MPDKNTQHAISRLIESLAIDMVEIAGELTQLARSGCADPDILEKLFIRYHMVTGLLKKLLRQYIAEDPVAIALLDEHLFTIALDELLAFHAIVHPPPNR